MNVIGVLCYQGGGDLHIEALKLLGFKTKKIFYQDSLDNLDGLILPGGESSVQYKYYIKYNLIEKVAAFAKTGRPILGTCAGTILLSKYSSPEVSGLGLIDIDVERNSYGKQISSGVKTSDTGNEIVFIRAPTITSVGEDVEILDTYNSKPIFVKHQNIFCTTFHPEVYKLDKKNILYTIFAHINAL